MTASLRRILALVVKEFLALMKEPRSRFIIIGPPIIQMLVFGYAATYDLSNVPYATYDEDRSAASRELLADFAGSPTFRLAASIDHHDDIRELIVRRDVLLVVHVGPNFARDALLGRGGAVQIVLDGRNSNTALIALGYARQIVETFSARWAQRHGLGLPPARLEPVAWYNPNLRSRWFFVPGVVAMLTLVVTVLVTGLSVAREREQGTFDQLLVTPLRPGEILLGKALPGFLIGIGEATVVILMAVLWFRVPLVGSLAVLYAGVAVFLACAVGVGLMISSLAATMQQGLLGAFLFLVPSVILSGFTTPIANMPPLVQKLTLLNPLRYFLAILRGVFLEGTPLSLLIHQFWPMALIAAVSLALAAWLFRHRVY